MYAHLANELMKTHIVDVLFQPNQLKKIVHLGERKRVGKKTERKEEGEEKGGGGKREGRKKKREGRKEEGEGRQQKHHYNDCQMFPGTDFP